MAQKRTSENSNVLDPSLFCFGGNAIESYFAELRSTEYADKTIRNFQISASEFNVFLNRNKVMLDDKFSLSRTMDKFVKWKLKERNTLGRRKYKERYTYFYIRNVLKSPIIKYLKYLQAKNIISLPDEKADGDFAINPLTNDIKAYIEYNLNNTSLVQTSLHRLKANLNLLASFLAKKNISSWDKLKIIHIDEFVEYKLHQSKSSGSTIASILRKFTKWLYLNNLIETDFSKLIYYKRAYRCSKVPKFLTQVEMSKLLSFQRVNSSESDLLIRAVVTLLTYTGIRNGDAVRLEIADIDLINKTIFLSKPKNGQALLLPAPDIVLKVITDYINNARPKFIDTNRLFIGVKVPRGPFKPRSMSKLIREYFRRNGIVGGPHRLRHTFAQCLLESGSELSNVSSLLGHSSLASTQIYFKTSMSRMREYVVIDEF